MWEKKKILPAVITKCMLKIQQNTKRKNLKRWAVLTCPQRKKPHLIKKMVHMLQKK